ncbi:acyltransferase family protein [Actinospongicola halichondriae]|uniref:acyltransferase family protein n=1 Tax=Actinospongicola halichondriae TaxID=3236844 RepID=UPI003D573B24
MTQTGVAPRGDPAPEIADADHRPELDGVRGLAVAAVLAFHLGVPWAVGGFLGVSTFFTLSGFLITRVLLTSAFSSTDTTGPDLHRFWVRRVRRLLPAAAVTLAGVAVLVLTEQLSGGPRPLQDLLSATVQVSNWWFFLSPDGYADLFADPSPVAHHWSLAIEEQVYLILPVVAWLCLRRTDQATGRRRLRLVLLAALSMSIVATVATDDLDLVYYGTHIRAGEVLLGALAATVGSTWPNRADPAPDRAPLRRWASALGVVALGATIAAWWTVELTDPIIRNGGLLAFGLVSTVLIVTGLRPGPLRSLLRSRGLVALGTVSYGTYLYHWPVYLWVDARMPDLVEPVAGLLQVGGSIALAVLSSHLLEQPIRRGSAGIERAFVAIGVVVIAIVALTLALPAPADEGADLADAARRLDDLVAGSATPDSVSSGRVRVSFFGDSTALVLGLGVRDRLDERGDDAEATVVPGSATLGCGVVRGDQRRVGGRSGPLPDECLNWPERWTEVLEAHPADVAVVLVGPFDVIDRRIDGGETWQGPGDEAYDLLALDELRRAVDVLGTGAEHVVLLTSPRIGTDPQQVPATGDDPVDRDPRRMDRFNELLREVGAERPAVTVIDMAAWFEERVADGSDVDLRPHGVHLSDDGTRAVGRWLVPQLVALDSDR